MKSCGIIVEYNPFHNGHQYHAKMARELSQADVVIAVMSGNFLQRGEPAIIDKWTRAKEALNHGVDLVVELPFAYAVQSADYFARGGIKLLHALECDSLCFGTDDRSEMDYQRFGEFVKDHQTEIDQQYQTIKNNGMSYPQQMTEVFRKIYPENGLNFSTPNHILGLSYAKENAHYDKPMVLYPLKREQAGYHDLKIHSRFASATAIRQAVFANELSGIRQVLPEQVSKDLEQAAIVSWENYWPLLKYKLISSSIEELQEIYQMKEGIEYRLKEAAKDADSFSVFIEKAKTKRYTWTRLQRLATYLLINVSQQEIEASWRHSHLHVLGFTEKGQQYLKEKKKTVSLPLITKVSKTLNDRLSLDIRSDQIYRLGNTAISEQNFGRSPIRLP
ncbi:MULTISPECIES: nucleotidyltransferase [unclassified Enterococcus]|uniref:nucleotidyltransferase n=1 Tax=unclassified Enterococcus TaxID=2608891 RepID=UPI001CE20BBE|nr:MULTISPECIES: nucleotidyltransferase [unclassified Enterococcus]MCA5011378.1 nucleotidyltransferase [Enterococcus sp. S23]MCA5015180.1 nucleotidyltransferase [Enterococcus sp. S22(2020)]